MLAKQGLQPSKPKGARLDASAARPTFQPCQTQRAMGLTNGMHNCIVHRVHVWDSALKLMLQLEIHLKILPFLVTFLPGLLGVPSQADLCGRAPTYLYGPLSPGLCFRLPLLCYLTTIISLWHLCYEQVSHQHHSFAVRACRLLSFTLTQRQSFLEVSKPAQVPASLNIPSKNQPCISQHQSLAQLVCLPLHPQSLL